MADPKPISLTQVDAADFDEDFEPEPFVIIGEMPAAGGEAVTWATLSGKPATFAPITGTAANQAKPGNYTPAWGDVTGKPTTFAPAAHAATLVNVAADAPGEVTAGNLQAVIAALAARIVALEALQA